MTVSPLLGLTQDGDTGQALVNFVGAQPPSQSQPHGTDPTRKVPKWFKMGKELVQV